MDKITRALTAKYVFDGQNLLSNKIVLIQNSTIVDIKEKDACSNLDIEDFGDVVLTAPFMDLQLNGCGGVQFNESISLQTLETMRDTNFKFGTMYFAPTLISSSFEDVLIALEVVKQWVLNYGNNYGVVALHLEGPFISLEKKGIHSPILIQKPSNQKLLQIVEYCKHFRILMTAAPEVFSDEQIELLLTSGVIISIGHSNSTYEEAEKHLKKGAQSVTHLFNAMSGLTARNPGMIGAVLNNPDVYAGIIPDLFHVHKANIQIATKIKPNHIYIVTDAHAPNGTEIGEFDLTGRHFYAKEGRCVDKDGNIVGSLITMNQAVKNCVQQCEIPLEKSLAMATSIPSKVIKVDDKIGKIAAGYRADIIALNLFDYSCRIISREE